MEIKRDENLLYLKDNVVVSDPCYPVGIWCSDSIEDILEGYYIPYIAYSDEGRVAELTVIHENYESSKFPKNFNEKGKEIITELRPSDIGVDSGQCGIYDKLFYESQKVSREAEVEFYNGILNLMGSEETYGLLENKGIVSLSGWGDGSYNCFTHKDKETGEVVGITVTYM